MQRLDWDDFYFTIAFVYASHGTCDRLRTACIIVDKNHKLVGAGYNGSIPGTKHCDDVGHLMLEGHCLRTLHGEYNAIRQSDVNLEGATAYILGTPCIDCMKKLLAEGVRIIKYAGEYDNSKGKEVIETLAREVGAELINIDLDFIKLLYDVNMIHKGSGGFYRDK